MSAYCLLARLSSSFSSLYPYSNLENHVQFDCDWFYSEAEHGPGFGPDFLPSPSFSTRINPHSPLPSIAHAAPGNGSFPPDEQRKRKRYSYQIFLSNLNYTFTWKCGRQASKKKITFAFPSALCERTLTVYVPTLTTRQQPFRSIPTDQATRQASTF